MQQLSQAKTEKVAQLVEMKGFFLKRSYAVKLDLAREIMETAKVTHCTGEEFLQYLESLKPTATKKEKAVPTFIGQVKASEADRPVLSGKRFIITSAQNETAVFSPFFNNLKAFAEDQDAQLIVLPVHYNTSLFSGQAKGDHNWYAEEVRDLLVSSDTWLEFCNGINLSASTNVLPTAVMPINTASQVVGSGVAAIVGHTKQQAKTLPRMKGQDAKWAFTTGTCTIRNYVQSAAGAKAEKDHAYGALLVEICSESLEWNVRQLRGSEIDGSFYDLELFIKDSTVYRDNDHKLGAVFGDVHGEKLDRNFYEKSLEFVKNYPINKIIAHDLHDFSSRNHHNRESGHFLASMLGRTVEEDLQTTSQILTDFRNILDDGDIIVVQSNHDDALKRWLDCNKYNASKDPINAVTYHKLNAAVYADIINKEPQRPILETALAELQLDSGMATFLNLDQSCLVHGVEVGYHGHTGTNGSRGSPAQFSKIGVPMVTGHTHSPSLIGNVTTVGCMNLEQDYNVGMSSWDLCHAVIYPNGYTSLIRLN